MGRHGNQGLAFADWPELDRLAWESAFRAGSLLRRGAGHHLSPTTKSSLKYNHGLFLGFLQKHDPDKLLLPISERWTRPVLAKFIEVCSRSCRETTIGILLSREYTVLKLLEPAADWEWFQRIQARARRRSTPLTHRQVTSSELYTVGHALLAQARRGSADDLDPRAVAELYRDGLMIKILATYPIRRAGLAALEFGKTLLRVGDRWSIYLPPENVKTRQSQQYELSGLLSADTDEYLECFWPHLGGSATQMAVWLYRSRPMGDKMIRRYICKRTVQALGFAVTPHRFRNAAATFISIAAPSNIRAAKDLLGHRTLSMTEEYYLDGARSREAGAQLSDLVEQMRRREGDYHAALDPPP